MKFCTVSLSLAALAFGVLPRVSAHGYISQVIIDGKAYAGNVPNKYQGRQ